MNRDYLYGTKDWSVDELAEMVATVLDITLEPHESSALGDYFTTPNLQGDGEIISVRPNYVDYGEEEDEIMEDEFPDYPVIVTVEDTQRGDELVAIFSSGIPGLDFLLRREY